MSKSIEERYKKKSQYEHIIDVPDTYIGSVEKTEMKDIWVYKEEMVKKTINITPGFFKIFDEIIVNAIDQYTRNVKKENSVTEIKVEIKNNVISVYNDGPGIDIEIHKEHNMYVPELIFGNLLTSTNYDKKKKRITGGKNGYGAKLTNIFSKKFIIETVDSERKRKYRQVFKDNMLRKSKPKITDYDKKSYTKITFLPDYEKFEMEELDEDTYSLLQKRVYDICACTKGVKVYFNKKLLKINSFEKYCGLYKVDKLISYSCERWDICIGLSDDDKLDQISFVNGISTVYGGTHVNYIVKKIARKLSKEISKKKSTKKEVYKVREDTIIDNLKIFVNCFIENPDFGGQIKDKLTTDKKKYGSECEFPETFYKKLMTKSFGLYDRVVNLTDFKNNKKIIKSDKKTKKKIYIDKLQDANFAGTKKSNLCTLILTEGDSAKASAVSAVSAIKNGTNIYGIFPLKGKILNARGIAMKKVIENKELENIKTILGLQYYEGRKKKVYENTDSLRYGKVMILTDQDKDGFHIKGLFFNYIQYFWPSLVKLNFLVSVHTAIVKATKGKEVKEFFNLTNFRKWYKNNDNWKIKYYKGLATHKASEARTFFKDLDKKLLTYSEDEKSDESMKLAFDKTKADDRKNWLENYKEEEEYKIEQNISLTEFINKDLIQFSMYDNHRSIPVMVDGLKPSQRKVLYGAICKNIKTDMKVANLASYVSAETDYHHGEKSLEDTIKNMAQNYVGSNNINLLKPIGQFGTRISNGKDAGSSRYIYTKLEDITHIIFNKLDNPLLEYDNNDEKQIEPKYFVPIIPMILVNGTNGIGTGYKTDVEKYNPVDIVNNIRHKMKHGEFKKMKPWYKGFKGEVTDTQRIGIYEFIKGNKIKITELPIGLSRDSFESKLNKMIENKKCGLKDYISKSSDIDIYYELQLTATEYRKYKANEKELIKDFKLSSSYSLNNINLFSTNGNILNYTINDILEHFYKIRGFYYQKRKDYCIKKYEYDFKVSDARLRFIKGVIDKSIVITGIPDEEIVRRLEELEFPKFNSPVYSDKQSDKEKNYDYLIDMKIRTLTLKKVKELEKNNEIKFQEYKSLKEKTVIDLWNEDLDEFLEAYKKF